MNRYERFLQKRGELIKLFEVANSDISICNSVANEENLLFWRRTQVRTVFATIEALCSHLKQSALMFDSADDTTKFTEIERLALEDRSYKVTDKGDIEITKAKIGLKQNICFSLRAFARSIDRPDDLVKDNGWNALQKSIEVRDRLTHPKTHHSFDVSEADIANLISGWEWFWNHAIKFSRSEN